mgnify:CR=1 FL=1
MKSKSEEFVRLRLERAGFDVTKLDEHGCRQPDFLVNDGTYTYLLEVKSKFPNPVRAAKRGKALHIHQTYSETGPIGYDDRIARILRDAEKQLHSKARIADFRIIWIFAEGYDANAKLQMVRSTLYGTCGIFDLDDLQFNKPCLYFHYSEFLRMGARIDAVVISSIQNGLICLNMFSSRYSELRDSRMCKEIGIEVLDPISAERDGAVLIADVRGSRKDVRIPLRYIQEKYGRPRLTYTAISEYFLGDVAVSIET